MSRAHEDRNRKPWKTLLSWWWNDTNCYSTVLSWWSDGFPKHFKVFPIAVSGRNVYSSWTRFYPLQKTRGILKLRGTKLKPTTPRKDGQHFNNNNNNNVVRDSSVGMATPYGLDGPGIESPWGSEIFRTSPDQLWGLPCLLYNGYRVFPRVKTAGAWRCPPTHNLTPR